MERNPDSRRLLAIFFAMALLFVLGPVNANIVPSERIVQYELANHPPGQIVMLIVIEEQNLEPVTAPFMYQQIERGVSVPYLGLITGECIVIEDYIDYQCNIYYTISRIDLKPDVLIGFARNPDKYPFAGNLGLRQRSSFYA